MGVAKSVLAIVVVVLLILVVTAMAQSPAKPADPPAKTVPDKGAVNLLKLMNRQAQLVIQLQDLQAQYKKAIDDEEQVKGGIRAEIARLLREASLNDDWQINLDSMTFEKKVKPPAKSPK